MNPHDLNQKAEQLLEKRDFKDALSAFQQVFLAHGKSEDGAILVEVARALRGAIYALQQMGQPEKAARILTALEARFGDTDESKTRYYVELARSGQLQAREACDSHSDAADELNFDEIEAQLAQAHQAATSGDWWAASNGKTPKILPEEHVSPAALEAILENAYFDCKTTDEVVRVQTDGPTIVISINASNHLLRFCAYYGLREFVSREEKLALANRINDGYILVRASIDDETTLIIDSYLLYKGGVLPVQIVTMLRLIGRIVPSALREVDAGDIVT